MSDLQTFLKNNRDMLEAAHRCLELRQHLPALVLIYSHIDTLAWAASDKASGTVRGNFEAWVDRWLSPELAKHDPNPAAVDIYAARCGVLHTMTGKSTLGARGAAKEISYTWGNASPPSQSHLRNRGRRGQLGLGA